MERKIVKPRQQEPGGPKITVILTMGVILAVVVMALFLASEREGTDLYRDLVRVTERYVSCELAADALKEASDTLTKDVQLFTITRNRRYLEEYFEEVTVSHRREDAVLTLEQQLWNSEAHRYLAEALRCSNALMERENYAMRLVTEALDYPPEECPEMVLAAALSPADLALSPEQKLAQAQHMVHDDEYQEYDETIDENVSQCIASLNQSRENIQRETGETLRELQLKKIIFLSAFALILVMIAVLIACYVVIPLRHAVSDISRHQPLQMRGAYELQYLAKAYNQAYVESRRKNSRLRHAAEHDPLTGLLNRGAFKKLWDNCKGQSSGLLLVDVDLFKQVNDTYGHQTGDKVLIRVSNQLQMHFRSSDYPCRVGGDEFAVVVTDLTPDSRAGIEAKLQSLTGALRIPAADGTPAVTLSIGIAFSDPLDKNRNVYEDADQALYRVKTSGRNGYAFFDDLAFREEKAHKITVPS